MPLAKTTFNLLHYSFKDVKIYYREEPLPDMIRLRMPLLGSRNIFTTDQNLVRIPQPMFVYMICLNIEQCNASEWSELDYKMSPGNNLGFIYVNGSNTTTHQGIYRRIIPAGTHRFDTMAAAYLFDVYSGEF